MSERDVIPSSLQRVISVARGLISIPVILFLGLSFAASYKAVPDPQNGSSILRGWLYRRIVCWSIAFCAGAIIIPG